MRTLIVCVAVGLVAALACGCSSPTAKPPPMTSEIEAELTAVAVARACVNECALPMIYVRDQLLVSGTTVGGEQPMPELTRLAIANELDGARFVDRDEAESLFGEDALVDGGRGVLISIGFIELLAADVVGIEVGVTTARDGGHGQVLQFLWTKDGWVPATSEHTGITVTSWVS